MGARRFHDGRKTRFDVHNQFMRLKSSEWKITNLYAFSDAPTEHWPNPVKRLWPKEELTAKVCHC